jgi:hypothetical protein
MANSNPLPLIHHLRVATVCLIPPAVLEPVRRQRRVDRGAGDRAMAEPTLDGPGVRELKPEFGTASILPFRIGCPDDGRTGVHPLGEATMPLAERGLSRTEAGDRLPVQGASVPGRTPRGSLRLVPGLPRMVRAVRGQSDRAGDIARIGVAAVRRHAGPDRPERRHTSAEEVGKPRLLFDHLVGDGEHARRNVEAKRLGGLDIDNEFKFGRKLERQVRRFCTLKNSSDVHPGVSPSVQLAGTIAHQPSILHIFAQIVHRGHLVSRFQRKEVVAIAGEQRAADDNKSANLSFGECCESGLKVGRVARL